jgi:hypothetical protein
MPITRRMRPGPLRVGQDFGSRYHVQKLLGSGGMGVVYQALDRELGVEIALKVLRAPAAGPKSAQVIAELQRRFRTELLLARQITHRNVIRIHDIGEINGIRFISMPLVKGPDLASLLENGRLSVSRSVRYARQIAAGLVAVHAKGVTHRDLKPSNIMINDEDQPLLMDFGIARSNAPAVRGRTVTGAVVGTLAYMAPEQIRGEEVDGRADIYAFGLILREMLCGATPNLSMPEVLGRLKTPPTPARQINPKVPVPLDEIVSRCLRPAAADRYQTAAELAAALAGLSRRAASGSDGRLWQWAARAAAVVAIAALGAGAVWLLATTSDRLLAAGQSAVSNAMRAWSTPAEAAPDGDAVETAVFQPPAPAPPPVRAAEPPETRAEPQLAIAAAEAATPVWTRVGQIGAILDLRRLLGGVRFGIGASTSPDPYEEFQVCYASPPA